MRVFSCAVLSAIMLSACAEPQPVTTRVPGVAVENVRLSALSGLSEAPDQACRTEATSLDKALERGLAGGTREDDLARAFDRVAACRQQAAEALIAGQDAGKGGRERTAAMLIGLRGAMRRDAARLESMLFNRPGRRDLLARVLAARDRQDQLVLKGG